jgi:amino acid transporter
MSKAGKGKLGFWAVVAIGVGGMVGGGIFAVLGLAVQLAHGGTPVAFAIAGAVALLTTYSYAKLSVAYPSRGGTVTFLDRAFGAGMFTGTLNALLWLSYVVMLSLYALAFGSLRWAGIPGNRTRRKAKCGERGRGVCGGQPRCGPRHLYG